MARPDAGPAAARTGQRPRTRPAHHDERARRMTSRDFRRDIRESIRHARDLGFTLEAIRDLLSLSDNPDQSCAAADTIARAQLLEVETRLARLTALKIELERMVVQCAGGRIADCRVIEVLGDHSLCATDHRHPETEVTS
ncbi:MerR family DNA-binding protein [Mesobacterium hydrothermale]|uniref:MerR family DNA-binding protein n=1 Tax=Mesobacterium hydrothermale TaxID=3111907 RepID=UPI003F497485